MNEILIWFMAGGLVILTFLFYHLNKRVKMLQKRANYSYRRRRGRKTSGKKRWWR